MHFQSYASTATVHEVLFADDFVWNATSQGDMQRSMDLFFVACDNFSLITNTEKTVLMHQPPPINAHNASKISVNKTQLQVMDNFAYLGSTLSRNTNIDDEIDDEATVHELFIVDACALNTTSEENMQCSMDLFSAACEDLCLIIKMQKTVVMH
nr:unnamed protein product [Spirometra erinaceieuropaei]